MSNYTKDKFCIIEGSENTVKTHFSPFLRHILVITVLIGGIYYPYRYRYKFRFQNDIYTCKIATNDV